MTEIEDFDKDITDALDNLQRDIDTINKKEPSQKQKLVSKCQNQIQSISMNIESYELEIHSLDKVKAVTYKESLKAIQSRFQRLKNELEFKKSEISSTNTLFQQKAPTNLKEMNGGQLIEMGNKIQTDGISSLQNTLKMVNEGNQMADDINIELNKQTEQLERTQNTVKETQVILKRANEYIKYFAKQLYTDKILMCLMFLVVVAIVVIIVLKVTGYNVSSIGASTNG